MTLIYDKEREVGYCVLCYAKREALKGDVT
jgi:hypothetical protein